MLGNIKQKFSHKLSHRLMFTCLNCSLNSCELWPAKQPRT